MVEVRKLAAIMSIDVVGYSRLMGDDESGTARAVKDHREALEPLVRERSGRIVKTMGDGLLLEFASVVAAVECALCIQKLMNDRNTGVIDCKRVIYRIGVNLGDVLTDGDDILGEGVNIAARLEAICDPGGVLISSAAYEHVRGKLDAEFVDLGEQALKNIARPVRAYALSPGALRFAPGTAFERRSSDPARLSVVVLPFVSLGGGAEHEDFVDGVTESLTTDLSRIRGAFVIGRSTAFAYKGKSVDLKQIGRELNVRYVLEGSVHRDKSRMRINVQLIEANTGSHLWAERFDKPVSDLFDTQDEIVARLANALSAQFVENEARRAQRTSNPDAVDLYFQGLAWLNRGLGPKQVDNARDFIERALVLDPDNVDALITSAQVDTVAAASSFVADPIGALVAAESKVIAVLSSVPDHARGHLMLGVIYIHSKRVQRGIAECEHAVALNRNLAAAHAFIGLGKILVGHAGETEQHILEALRLSPRDQQAYLWMKFAGDAKYTLGFYDEAVDWLVRSIEVNRNFPLAYFSLATSLVELGRLDEAKAAVKAGLALDPMATISRARLRAMALSANAAHADGVARALEACRKAGVPE